MTLSKAQRKVIETLNEGGTLEYFYRVRAQSIWKLYAPGQIIGTTVNTSTVEVLEKRALIKVTRNYRVYPPEFKAQLKVAKSEAETP